MTALLVVKLVTMLYICFLHPESGIHFFPWRKLLRRVRALSLVTAALSMVIIRLNPSIACVTILPTAIAHNYH